MRGLTGMTLVLAGAAAAFYGIYPEAGDRKDAADRALVWFGSDAQPSAARSADLPLVVVDPQRRAFSPQAPLFQQVPRGEIEQQPAAAKPTTASASHAPAPRAAAAAATDADTAPAPAAAPSGTRFAAVVTDHANLADLAPPAVAVPPADRAAVPPRTPVTASKAGGEDAQRELTRNLQKELKRVGCYDGDITGSWSPASRRAMKSFTDRVNATLPVEEPDYILLTLVQGHGGTACGARCPADQAMAKDGRCQPRAIVAQAEKKAIKRAQPTTAATTAAAPATRTATAERPAARSPEVGRAMEMWSKVTPDATAAGPKAVKSDGWTTAVVAAVPPPAPPPVVAPVSVAAPLPGRMAIGGPVDSRPASNSAGAAAAARTSVAAIDAPAPAASAAAEATQTDTAAAKRRIPSNVVHADRPRPRRARDNGAVQAPRPVQVSKAARVRSMHYNLFSRPDRVTN